MRVVSGRLRSEASRTSFALLNLGKHARTCAAAARRFVTKVWHPNVSSQTGAICLDVLKDAWTPAMTLISLLLSVRALLAAAEPTDPQDAQVARQYLSDRKAFDATARAWSDAYATPSGAAGAAPAAPIDPRVKQLMEMGFGHDQAESALASAGSVGGAVAMLLSG